MNLCPECSKCGKTWDCACGMKTTETTLRVRLSEVEKERDEWKSLAEQGCHDGEEMCMPLQKLRSVEKQLAAEREDR